MKERKSVWMKVYKQEIASASSHHKNKSDARFNRKVNALFIESLILTPSIRVVSHIPQIWDATASSVRDVVISHGSRSAGYVGLLFSSRI